MNTKSGACESYNERMGFWHPLVDYPATTNLDGK